MPPPQSSSDVTVDSVDSLKRQLRAITEAFACPICHATLRAPVQLPCEHMLCSECARRHLSSASVCPQPFCKSPATATAIVPLRALDAALDAVRGELPRAVQTSSEKGSKLVFLSHKDARAKARFVERLHANELPTDGPLDMLAARDREFVIRWNANLDAAVPRSKKEVAREIMANERHRERERRKAAHASSAAFFAAKPKTVEDPDVPVEGDSFAALIRKVRARKARLKRERKETSAEEMELLPVEKVARLRGAEGGLDISGPLQPSDASATGEGKHAVDRTTEAHVWDVDADTFAIPPTPPSIPPSPCETALGAENNAGSPSAVRSREFVVKAEIGAKVSGTLLIDCKAKAGDSDVILLPSTSGSLRNICGSTLQPMRPNAMSSRSPQSATGHVSAQTQSPAIVSTLVSTQAHIDMPGSGGQPQQPPSSATPPFSEEQKRRIEQNRQRAIERKKLYLQRLRREQMRQPDF